MTATSVIIVIMSAIKPARSTFVKHLLIPSSIALSEEIALEIIFCRFRIAPLRWVLRGL
jgi:hypothetical protein